MLARLQVPGPVVRQSTSSEPVGMISTRGFPHEHRHLVTPAANQGAHAVGRDRL
jgi:hypothetical protein